MAAQVYITHARTLAELKEEFTGDIHRRLETLDREQSAARSAAEKMRIARAIVELQLMLEFWTRVQIPAKSKGKVDADA